MSECCTKICKAVQMHLRSISNDSTDFGESADLTLGTRTLQERWHSNALFSCIQMLLIIQAFIHLYLHYIRNLVFLDRIHTNDLDIVCLLLCHFVRHKWAYLLHEFFPELLILIAVHLS